MVLADAGGDVVLWGKDADLAADHREHHAEPRVPPGRRSCPTACTRPPTPVEALDGADLVVLAVPAQVLRPVLGDWRGLLPGGAVLVSLMKGIELGTMHRMSEVVAEVAAVPDDRVAVVSGPNLAGEIVLRQPAATVVACTDEAAARRVQAGRA